MKFPFGGTKISEVLRTWCVPGIVQTEGCEGDVSHVRLVDKR